MAGDAPFVWRVPLFFLSFEKTELVPVTPTSLSKNTVGGSGTAAAVACCFALYTGGADLAAALLYPLLMVLPVASLPSCEEEEEDVEDDGDDARDVGAVEEEKREDGTEGT